MATAVLTSVPTVISLCESTTGWSGDTFSLNTDFPKQGTNAVSCAMTNNGTNNIQYATSNSPGGTFAATNIHIRLWINLAFVGNIDTTTNDGIQVQVVSGAGTALYTVGGSDTYNGGWVQLVIYTGDTPTTGSVPSGTCTAVGLTVNTTSKPRNQPANCYVDAWYFGDGYTVTGGTDGDEIDWSHRAALDLVEAYGIVERVEDIYFLKGAVAICNSATTTWFKSGQKVQFANIDVSSTLYNVTFAGTGCRVDITGGAWGAAGTQDYLIDADDTDLVSFTMSGVQFTKANSVLLDSVSDVQNCVFDACGQVVTNDCTFKFNSFVNCIDTGGAVLFPANDANFSDLSFSLCDKDIEYDATSDTTTPTLTNIIHDDNAGDFDVNNTSGSAVTFALSGTSNGNSSTGSAVTFSSSSTLTLTVKDEDGVAIATANAYIDDNNVAPFVMNTTTNGSGIATTSWTGGAVVGATWRVRKYGYKAYKAIADVPASGTKDIPVTLIADPQQV